VKQRRGVIVAAVAAAVLWLVSAPASAAPLPREMGSSTEAGLSAMAVSSGSRHTCALTGDGGVMCWGANGSGQLGDDSKVNRSEPVRVAGLTDRAVAISAGGYHTCAFLAGGGVSCWGWNLLGQLGDATVTDRLVAVRVKGLSAEVVAISAGGGQACALTQVGAVECWGGNNYGQLGDGTLRRRSPTPVKVLGLSGEAVAISVGGRHACALITTGEVNCWGANSWGQLGDGTVRTRSRAVSVRGLSGKAVAITAGRYYTCAVIGTRRVECWGSNYSRQLGNPHPGYTVRPVPVTLLSGAVAAVSAGERHACALMTDSTVRCWGSDGSGQLGLGLSTSPSGPVRGFHGQPVAVSAGSYHTCAVTSEGTIDCWGSNYFGQLGTGTLFSTTVPVAASGLSQPASAITAGQDHTCALLRSGSLECWGWNGLGQLGDGTKTDRASAVQTAGLPGEPIAVSAGGRHTCVLATTIGGRGEVACWGANNHGQVGDGTTAARSRPVPVDGLAESAAAVDAGEEHTCALLLPGTVACWGANGSGQLGDGSSRDAPKPVTVQGLLHATAVSAGGYHACALTSTGGIDCWGANYSGQLGDGTTRSSAVPVAVKRLSGLPVVVATGFEHTCALTSQGEVECWGANDRGQVGSGATSRQPVLLPMRVRNLGDDVVALALGARHSCALTRPGSVTCWGENGMGQLGSDTAGPSASPVSISLPGPAAEIGAGEDHTCAMLRSGDVWCWGWNYFGQLGDGPVPASGTSMPVGVVGFGQ
jgi:alpha-tubulin suppressor-like RCC1 family protein